MAKRDWKDVAAGSLVIAIGLGFMSSAYSYGLGDLVQMGAGYFPFAVGFITSLLGLLILLLALFREGRIPVPEWRPLIFCAGSVLVFTLTIGALGLVPAVLMTLFFSACADKTARLASTIPLSIGVAFGVYVVFVTVLGIPIPAFKIPL